MIRHTPGLWTAQPNEHGWSIVGPSPRPDDPMVWLVARTVSDEPEDAANARLITAAPDLLDACKEALLWYGPDGDHVSEPARSLLLAAIAKAEQP